ncbi:hypothetical protein GCT13_30545 [Paraburkholderia sp. CNPSo 3157]|uniref:Uncharacterized protein n=1 Tax=Paraburkholderia franconis TaxID=2654983 RepID=A0A7X1NGI9_9BURK|nr:hypothetical protein [Paraburkholderia franconis]MPW21098.1 hypothetical protein [Paraburkholderia franconis]
MQNEKSDSPITSPLHITRRLSALERISNTAVEHPSQRVTEFEMVTAMISTAQHPEAPETDRKPILKALERMTDIFLSEAIDGECLMFARNRSPEEWDELDDQLMQQGANNASGSRH